MLGGNDVANYSRETHGNARGFQDRVLASRRFALPLALSLFLSLGAVNHRASCKPRRRHRINCACATFARDPHSERWCLHDKREEKKKKKRAENKEKETYIKNKRVIDDRRNGAR
ncbi:hypothetical protein PUN28_018292 [Cardiocondyla obscurior]|uniref:Uncharacterized protein n=1 Tax=Cardiocondyla obscurior TaxID=286306 RepID=A0AAW2ELD3_9HYME